MGVRARSCTDFIQQYLGLVINSIDNIMHGMTLGELGMHDPADLVERELFDSATQRSY